MSENITSGGSTIHGVLVIVAAIIGVVGYIIRSRLNQKELQKQEIQKQEEERRRAALHHCKQQLDVFIGPVMALSDANSAFCRYNLYLHHEHEFVENVKKFQKKKDNTYFDIIGESTIKRLKDDDAEAIKFLKKYKYMYENLTAPCAELYKKYQYNLSEMPTQEEHDEMYPGLKGKHQLSIYSLSIASIAHAMYIWKEWDGKTK